MKPPSKKILARAVCGALVSGVLVSAAPARAADIVVVAEGLEAKGALVVALFDSEAAWRARKDPVRQAILPVGRTTVQATFEGLPPGRYALMAYHDRNGDGRLNTLPIGLPVEPYGFSNGARGTFGPPTWRAAAFEAPATGATQSLRLR